MLMTRLENEPEEEEPKTTEPRRRLELGKAEPEEPEKAGRSARHSTRSTRNHQQNQGSPKRKKLARHGLYSPVQCRGSAYSA